MNKEIYKHPKFLESQPQHRITAALQYCLSTIAFLLVAIISISAQPRIVFRKKVFDFGKIIEGKTVSCNFSFSNQGDSALKILHIEAKCGCTVANLDKKTYNPGEKGRIDVTFHSTGRKGKIAKHIFLLTNDEENKHVMLTVTGIVKKTWLCEPKKIEFGEIEKDTILTDSVQITSIVEDSIRVDSLITEPKGLEAEIISHKGDKVKLKVSLDSSKIKYRFVGVVKFYSNISIKRRIIIPVFARLKEDNND
jgi:hypothetical protein